MRNSRTFPLLFAACFALACTRPPATVASLDAPVGRSSIPIVCFVPGTGCESEIVQRIASAKKSVLIQAYSFTSSAVADALISARARGIDVRVILDQSDVTARGSQFSAIVNGGVPTWIDAQHAIAHNKVIVYDGAVVETGSYNFTNAAEHQNAENAVFISSVALAKQYADNWETHRQHSTLVSGSARPQ